MTFRYWGIDPKKKRIDERACLIWEIVLDGTVNLETQANYPPLMNNYSPCSNVHFQRVACINAVATSLAANNAVDTYKGVSNGVQIATPSVAEC